jgi:hypothetical protein
VKVKEQKSTDRKAEKTKEHETKAVEAATQNSPEKIMKALGEMKLECVRMLDGLGERRIAGRIS